MFFLRELPDDGMLERYAEHFPEMNKQLTREALHMMRRASLLIRELEAYFTSEQLSFTRFLILIVLDREPQAQVQTLTELTRRLDISKPVVTNTVKSMLAAGLVELSNTSADDKRSKQVSLTAWGRQRLYQLLPGYYQRINQFMEHSDDID